MTEGRIQYEDGSVYVGEVKDGKRHGRGTYTWGSGKSRIIKDHPLVHNFKMKGETKKGDPMAKIFIMKGYTFGGKCDLVSLSIKSQQKGDKYEGEFKEGKRHGRGTYTWSNGHKYDGEWKGCKRHGRGTYTQPDGKKYEGGWKNGENDGRGIYTWPDGEKYDVFMDNDWEMAGEGGMKRRLVWNSVIKVRMAINSIVWNIKDPYDFLPSTSIVSSPDEEDRDEEDRDYDAQVEEVSKTHRRHLSPTPLYEIAESDEDDEILLGHEYGDVDEET